MTPKPNSHGHQLLFREPGIIATVAPLRRAANRVAITVVCALVLGLAGCNGGDNRTVNNPDGDVDTADLGGQGSDFGSDGQPAFRLRTNNNGFNLEEGTSITVPVTIDRANGHSRRVELILGETNAPDEKLLTSLVNNFLENGQTQTIANLTFLHDRQRTTEQQRTVTVTANDGATSSQVSILLNIRPTRAPDIYLLAGQSNMVGFSEYDIKDTSPGGPDERNPSILQLNVTANDTVTFDSLTQFGNPAAQVAFPEIVEAEDPLHTSKDPSLDFKVGTQVGLGLSFAKRALVNDGTHQILLVPAAWSSTGFCDTGSYLASVTDAPDFIAEGGLGWNAFAPTSPVFGGTTLFTRAVLRTNIAIQQSGGILRGILWHQGESDGDNPTCAAAYAGNLGTLASELRTRIIADARGTAARGATSDVPFIAGTMSRGNDFRGDFSVVSPSKELVDNAHRNAGAQGLISYYGVAILDDLIPSNGYPCGEGSCVHFGSGAYREMGSRYFDTLQSVLARP